MPAMAAIRLDYRVLLFNMGLALVTGILFGVAPAMQVSGIPLNETLKESGRGASEGRSAGRFRGALAVFEVALAMVLLSGSGLLLKSFLRVRGIELGYTSERILTFAVSPTAARYPKPLDQARLLEQVLERVKSVPGVRSASGGECLPLTGASMRISGLALPDRPGTTFETSGAVVSPDFFDTMRIRLLRGRVLSDADREGAPGAVVVNESFVRKVLANEGDLGRRIEDPNHKTQWLTIVGVVRDTRPSPEEDAGPEIYLSYLQPGDPDMARSGDRRFTVVLRAAGDPMSLVPALRARMAALDPTTPPHSFKTLDDLRAEMIAPRRVNTLLIGMFAGLALVLGCIGIYGVLAYSVGRRTHEIGVRLTLGADRAHILGMVLRKGMLMIAGGIALGVAASFGVTRLLASELWGVSPNDPWTLATVAAVLGGSGLAACWIPAHRATRVDPISALRCE
jgi:putative ABC transport system permease protein